MNDSDTDGACNSRCNYMTAVASLSMSVDATEVIDISERLLNQHPTVFTDDFEQNKAAVERLTDIRTHHTLNRITGHITRQQTPRGETDADS